MTGCSGTLWDVSPQLPLHRSAEVFHRPRLTGGSSLHCLCWHQGIWFLLWVRGGGQGQALRAAVCWWHHSKAWAGVTGLVLTLAKDRVRRILLLEERVSDGSTPHSETTLNQDNSGIRISYPIKIPARAQPDFMLFHSANVRHSQKGLRALAAQWPLHRQVLQRPMITGPFLCFQCLQKLIQNECSDSHRGAEWMLRHQSTLCSAMSGSVLHLTFCIWQWQQVTLGLTEGTTTG